MKINYNWINGISNTTKKICKFCLPRAKKSFREKACKSGKHNRIKIKKISKPFARKIQILTVGEQRAKVMGKSKVASIFKKGKEAIRKGRKK